MCYDQIVRMILIINEMVNSPYRHIHITSYKSQQKAYKSQGTKYDFDQNQDGRFEIKA